MPESLNFESLRTDARNLIESFQKKDYQFCSTLRQLQNIERGKVIGLFASGGLPAAINRDESTVSIPSVKEMGIIETSSNIIIIMDKEKYMERIKGVVVLFMVFL